MKKYKAYVISHTHWDREWYQTFQQYRRRLVRMVDGLIDGLEKDPSYQCFHFDGQTIMIQDYLRVRPEKKERLFRLIRDGRIIIGPWYTMPDEFLVSGESLVQNIQKGLKICEEIGAEPMMSGFVDDIFGHNSQFPQILRGFGMDNAVMFRGIGDYPKDQFRWESPDGSSVRAYKLDKDRSYSNFYFAVRWPFERLEYSDEALLERAEKLMELARSNAAGNILLMMDGVDHIDMHEDLPRMLALLNEKIEDVEFIHADWNTFNAACEADAPELETIKGPLYNLGRVGMNNVVLKNVVSSMIQLKQANDRCETKLAKLAAPIEALIYQNKDKLRPETLEHTMLPYDGFLDTAWDYLFQNQPHDSICGCSVSEVHMDNEYRFRQCEQIADMMISEGLGILSQNIDCDTEGKNGGFLVYNFGQTDRDGMAVVTVQMPWHSGWDFSLYDADGNEIEYQLISTESGLDHVAEYNKVIDTRWVHLVTMAIPLSVKRFGYTSFTYEFNHKGDYEYGDYTFGIIKQPYRMQGSMRTAPNAFDNGVLTVTVNPNGSLTVTDKASGRVYENLLTFEDCGDYGDGWLWKKPQFDRQFNTACSNCDFAVKSDGKHAAVFSITHRMTLPTHITDGDTRVGMGSEVLEFETTVTLVKNSRRLDFETKLKNNVECHRLRVMFPTGIKADHYYGASPFDMQKWPVKKPETSRYSEQESNVYPSQGITFLSDGKDHATLYSKGLYEVEVTDNDSRTIALTLFRAYRNETGRIGRLYPDMKRDLAFQYALDFEPTTPSEAVVCADSFRCGLVSAPLNGRGNMPTAGTLAAAEGATALSTMYAVGENETVLRFVNYNDQPERQSITLSRPVKSAETVDFLGKPTGEQVTVSGSTVTFELGAHKIGTLRVVY